MGPLSLFFTCSVLYSPTARMANNFPSSPPFAADKHNTSISGIKVVPRMWLNLRFQHSQLMMDLNFQLTFSLTLHLPPLLPVKTVRTQHSSKMSVHTQLSQYFHRNITVAKMEGKF